MEVGVSIELLFDATHERRPAPRHVFLFAFPIHCQVVDKDHYHDSW